MSETYVFEALASGLSRMQQQRDALLAERQKLLEAEARLQQIDQQVAALNVEIDSFAKRVDAHRPVVTIPTPPPPTGAAS